MSILSALPDGMGFYYGFAKPDMRRIDVANVGNKKYWAAYVAGEPIDSIGYDCKETAEEAALAWLKAHPQEVTDVED